MSRIPYFMAGSLLTVSALNQMVDAINDRFEEVQCAYCGRYGALGSCQGCGAPNAPVSKAAREGKGLFRIEQNVVEQHAFKDDHNHYVNPAKNYYVGERHVTREQFDREWLTSPHFEVSHG